MREFKMEDNALVVIAMEDKEKEKIMNAKNIAIISSVYFVEVTGEMLSTI